jgi:hypothetical protein
MRPQASAPYITADQIVARVQQQNHVRAQSLKGYTGLRIYRLEYKGLGSLSAEMVVQSEFVPPATKRFRIISERGSQLLRDKVFRKLLEAETEAANPAAQRATALSGENYRFQLIGEQPEGEHDCYVISVEPLRNDKFLYRGKIWVDSKDYAVVKIDAEPAKNPSFWIARTEVVQVYGRVGEFWLPINNRSVSHIKVGGTATLTIEYGQYATSVAVRH